MLTRIRTILSCAAAFALPALLLPLATLTTFAASSHSNAGGAGNPDTDGLHGNNPGHVWTKVGAPVSAQVSSGGRFHDNCIRTWPHTTGYPLNHKDACYGAHGGNYAIDQAIYAGNNPYTPIKLYIDWAGWATGYTYQPDISGPTIAYYVVAGSRGYYGTGSPAGCHWQAFHVYVEYWDMAGIYHYEQMGTVYFGHGFNWVYSPGATVYSNANRWLPDGSLQWYLNGVTIGYVYPEHNNAVHPSCTTGDHVHTEWVSTHNHGSTYEWHGWGPDFYWTYHVHGGNGDFAALTPYSSPSAGAALGFLGGNTILPAVW